MDATKPWHLIVLGFALLVLVIGSAHLAVYIEGDSPDQAYYAGEHAALSGMSTQACPYGTGERWTKQRVYWLRGWNSGREMVKEAEMIQERQR